jgi:hypothetical protein
MTDPTDADAAVWVFPNVETEQDALEVRLVDLERKYIDLARYLQRDVFPRLDRIENELEIDEEEDE